MTAAASFRRQIIIDGCSYSVVPLVSIDDGDYFMVIASKHLVDDHVQ